LAINNQEKKKLIAFFRNGGPSREKKYVLTAVSSDLGRSWSEVQNSSIPNPNSGFDMIKLDNGSYLGAVNYSFDPRNNLTLIVSHDKGKNWRKIKVVDYKPFRVQAEEQEYSYPSIARDKSGNYHISYTYEKIGIKHVTFNDAWLKKQLEEFHH